MSDGTGEPATAPPDRRRTRGGSIRRLLRWGFVAGGVASGVAAAPDIMIETAIDAVAPPGPGPTRPSGQTRLALLQGPPPKALTIVGAVIGVALMASRIVVTSTLGTVLFFVGLGLVVIMPIIYVGARSERRLTDSTPEARRIALTGIPAVATLNSARYTNVTLGSSDHTRNDRPVYELDLTISSQDSAEPYRVLKKLSIAPGLSGLLVPGFTFEVRVDPADPSVVVLP